MAAQKRTRLTLKEREEKNQLEAKKIKAMLAIDAAKQILKQIQRGK